jgi:hypothetical protein
MKNLKSFSEILEKNWIQDAVGKNKGSLRRHFGKTGDEKITKGEIQDEISDLKKKDKDKEKPGAQLGKRDAKLYKQLNLAKTLTGLKEGHNDTENYMFFANVMNIHRMCEAILEMDPMQVDAILQNGHGWATDHIATSKDDVEEVYNFLYADSQSNHDTEEEGDVEGMVSDGANC